MLLPSVDANPDLPHTAPIESSSNKVEMRANEFSDTDESESIINRISERRGVSICGVTDDKSLLGTTWTTRSGRSTLLSGHHRQIH